MHLEQTVVRVDVLARAVRRRRVDALDNLVGRGGGQRKTRRRQQIGRGSAARCRRRIVGRRRGGGPRLLEGVRRRGPLDNISVDGPQRHRPRPLLQRAAPVLHGIGGAAGQTLGDLDPAVSHDGAHFENRLVLGGRPTTAFQGGVEDGLPPVPALAEGAEREVGGDGVPFAGAVLGHQFLEFIVVLKNNLSLGEFWGIEEDLDDAAIKISQINIFLNCEKKISEHDRTK